MGGSDSAARAEIRSFFSKLIQKDLKRESENLFVKMMLKFVKGGQVNTGDLVNAETLSRYRERPLSSAGLKRASILHWIGRTGSESQREKIMQEYSKLSMNVLKLEEENKFVKFVMKTLRGKGADQVWTQLSNMSREREFPIKKTQASSLKAVDEILAQVETQDSQRISTLFSKLEEKKLKLRRENENAKAFFAYLGLQKNSMESSQSGWFGKE